MARKGLPEGHTDYYINNKRHTVKITGAKVPSDKEYREILQNPEYQEFLAMLTIEGRNTLKKNVNNLLQTEAKVPHIKLSSGLKKRRKIIVADAIMKILEAREIERKKKTIIDTKEKAGEKTATAAHIIAELADVETKAVNKDLMKQFESLDIPYVPYVFKYDREVRKVEGMSNFLSVFATIDEEYLNTLNLQKATFATWLSEKGEFKLSSIVFVGKDATTSGNVNTFIAQSGGVLNNKEEKKLRALWHEFYVMVKNDPSKFKWSPEYNTTKLNGKPITLKKAKMPVLNIRIIDSRFPVSRYNYDEHGLKQEMIMDSNIDATKKVGIWGFNDPKKESKVVRRNSKGQIIKPRVQDRFIAEYVKNNNQKRSEAERELAMYNAMMNTDKILQSRDRDKSIPHSVFKSSPEVVKKVISHGQDRMIQAMLKYYDMVIGDGEGELNEAYLAKRKKELGIDDSGFQIPESQQWWKEREVTVKFPNVDAILFWWIRSGQYKMTSEKLQKRWDSVKNYHPERRANFLNSLTFMIANAVFLKKIQQHQKAGHKVRAVLGSGLKPKKRLGAKRGVKIAQDVRVGNKSRSKAMERRRAKWVDYNTRLRDVNPNAGLSRHHRQKGLDRSERAERARKNVRSTRDIYYRKKGYRKGRKT